MGIIVEDGSKVTNANSYASVNDANSRFSDRGNTSWDAIDDDVKASSLISATDYLTQVYRLLWAGYRVSPDQALDWPRYEVPIVDSAQAYGVYSGYPTYYKNNIVPTEVRNATIDLALKAASGVILLPDLEVPVIQETVGPITVKYDKNARQTPVFSAINAMLNPLLLDGGTQYLIPLTRG